MATDPHPPLLIDTLEKLDEALNHWKNTTFSQHYLKLEDVVESLRQPHGHMVDAHQEFAARWVLCPPGGKKPATMWTAAVWWWNSDLDTGNFVPPGEIAPARLPESRIQSMPNNMCRFTYVLDTTHDKSLWEAQRVFEEHITKVNKFNPGKKARREFQNGVSHTHTFHLSSQIFVKRTAYTRAREASRTYPLHDWIRNATKKGMPFFANNEKPSLFELDEEGGLRPLSESYPPTLKVGDLVWMSFGVEFFIGNMNWSTNLIPFEFVRVGSVALELLPDIKKEFDDGEDEEGPRERLGVGMRGISAAEANQLNEAINPPPLALMAQPAGVATPPNTDLTAIETNTNVASVEVSPDIPVIEANSTTSTLVPNGPDSSRNLAPENFAIPRNPRTFIDSESEESTSTRFGNNTDEDEDDSTTQDFMSVDDNFFIFDDDDDDNKYNFNDDDDDDSSLTDIADDAASFKDDTPALDAASTAESSASAVASVSSPTSSGKAIKQLSIIDQPEVNKRRSDAAEASPKLNKKRPASSERVLRKRIAKGKGVARS